MGAGIIVVDPKGRFLLFNKAARRILGRGPVPGGPNTWPAEYGMHAPDKKTRYRRAEVPLVRALKGRPVDDEEVFVRNRAFRKGRTIRMSARPLKDSGGRTLGAVAVLRDITVQRTVERALRKSEVQLRSMFDHARIGMALASTEGALVEVNPAFCDMLGYQEKEIVGRHFQDFTHPDDLGQSLGLQKALREPDRPSRGIEKRYLRKDGTVLWAAVNVARILDESGKLRQTVAQVEDITQRRIAERALRESEERFRSLFEQSNAGLAILDSGGRFVQVNPAWSELLGYSAGEMNALSFRDITHPDDLERSSQVVEAFEKGDLKSTRVEKRYVRKNGEVVFGVLSLSASYDSEGKLTRYFAQLQDVSDRQRLERDVIEAGTREQIRIGQDLHDGLGQQLTAVSLTAESLSERLKKKGEPDAQAAAKIAELSNLANKETRNLALLLQPVDQRPEGLMRSLEGLAASTTDLWPVTCRFECPAPVRVGDPLVATHLSRIAQEAVRNACRHGKPTTIIIELKRVGKGIRLSVRDNGKGMPRKPASGRGLGLRIMKSRAGMIGGRLDIRPAKRKGTRVICIVEPSGPPTAPGSS